MLRNNHSFFTMTGLVGFVLLLTLTGCPDPNDPRDPGPTTYTVTYDGNYKTGGDVPVDSTAYTSGQTATVLNKNTLSRTSYEFGGWNTAADGSGIIYQPDESISVTANITLYARWISNSTLIYTITYHRNTADSGNVPASARYKSRETVTVLGNTGTLVKTGIEFGGWNTQADGSGTTYHPGESFSATANITLYVRWTTAATYTITYDRNTADSGTVPVDTNKYITGDSAPVLGNSGNLTKANNTFMGWNTEADGTGDTYPAGNTILVTSADIVLYARWSPAAALHVTYNKNLGTGNVPVDNTDYNSGQTVTVLGNGGLTRSGYRFDGWNTKADGSGTDYQPPITFIINADTILYAKWTQIFTVTYNGNNNTGGTAPVDSNSPYDSGASVTVLGNTGTLARTGYRFDGWNTATNGSGTTYQPTGTVTINADTILYAKWTQIFTVTYFGNSNTGGTVPVDSNSPYDSGASVTVLGQGDLVRTGYRFDGWSNTSSGSVDYVGGGTFTITANKTLYAKWTFVYTLTYNGNGASGTVPADPTLYTSGQQATVLGNTGLTNAGKIFDSWNTAANGSGNWYCPGDTISMTSNTTLYAIWVTTTDKVFHAMRLTNDTWYTVTAKRLAVGNHCIVYADQYETSITPADGQAVAAKYDTYIHNSITGAFGGIEDVDKNGRVIFLMLDIVDGYSGSGGYVAGYFQGYQMYSQSIAGYSHSNEADMLYMDTNPGFNSGNSAVMQSFYSTMAHELQHLIEFSQTVAKGKAEKDIWINEGLSTGAEYIYGNGTGSPAQQTSRINYFNAGTNTIPYGNNFFVWNGFWEQPANGGDVLADYSTAYLFFQWIRIHASNGTGIYKDIIASTYGDYRAVTGPASSKINSSLSTWGNLLGDWLLANLAKSSTGLLGYKNQINTSTYLFPGSSTSWPFSPGEGVFSSISGGSVIASSSYSSPNIKYVGIPNGGYLDETGPTYSGVYLLTYNANSNKAGLDESGKIASNVVSSPQASVQMSLNGNAATAPSALLPTSYPIDVHFGPDGTVSPDSPPVGTGKTGKAKPHGIGK